MLPHWTENDIDVNGVRIHYIRTGGGSKPALVLAHGFSDNGLCWLPVARDLEPEFDVIMPDARGHGQSQRVQPGEPVDNAADMAGFIQAMGLQQPVLGGHSMGGNTAASTEARFHGLVRALILEDPGWRDRRPTPAEEEEEAKPNPWFEWLMSLESTPIEAVMAKGRADNPTWPEVEMYPWALSKKQLDTNIVKVNGVWMNWDEQAKGIQVPALLLTAEPAKGAIVDPDTAKKAKELSACINEVNIPDVGHCIRRENYDAFMQAVRAFLKSLP